ncbi:DUF960 domain-containing protein [Streptococcus porcinus]|uniref:Staphylococcal protein of uncharacterized function (DUF960) n=2 Tax=Streptococcus porcinus TaxID=1340 RepID=A0A4V0H3A2_STRPO|nr:DUF960 domain-containing protein [Streptococcus porcinus]EGJ27254.1 hypothetical protein STRPO_1829 [Streptococcus porcinus str. Jelinkova 176]SQG43036.1 Staphylococcal protein of uncharacterised function (DUF960) [Streptococcus porcinus]VTT42023.1 Staphylococcal protein of uncharacterised function (DUF960) [Streptococcus porcinus]VTT43437.1 Staphylococcal protein of uncharacterised function (DUF960) [Streptococcus porcinus]
MAFQNTRERYASFGVATSIPPEIIDIFWHIIDENLKGVFPLDRILLFALVKNSKNNLSIEYHDKKKNLLIVFDYDYPYDPFLPKYVYAIDNDGLETILLKHEIS